MTKGMAISARPEILANTTENPKLGNFKLYNVVKDSKEKFDLSGTHPEKVAELLKLYDAWFADIEIG